MKTVWTDNMSKQWRHFTARAAVSQKIVVHEILTTVYRRHGPIDSARRGHLLQAYRSRDWSWMSSSWLLLLLLSIDESVKEGDVMNSVYNWCSSNKFKSHLKVIHKMPKALCCMSLCCWISVLYFFSVYKHTLTIGLTPSKPS